MTRRILQQDPELLVARQLFSSGDTECRQVAFLWFLKIIQSGIIPVLLIVCC